MCGHSLALRHPSTSAGARLALAAKAAAIAAVKQDWTIPPSEEDEQVIWEGPRAVTARAGAHGTIEVVFSTSGGLALNASAACPPALLASPLGRISCSGAGFELNVGGETALVASAAIKAGEPNTIVLKPAAGQNMSTIGDHRSQNTVRYAYADWPVCSVRNAKSSGGSTTMPLPARIFDLPICGGDRCPGLMCPTSRCPLQPLPQKADDELAATMATVGSVLAARAGVAAPPPPPENFIRASDPSCWYTGRTQINADGSRSFDWEGTQLWVNIMGASYITMVRLNASFPLWIKRLVAFSEP
jgi:hypothetical protein